jgi:hypothetical protein
MHAILDVARDTTAYLDEVGEADWRPARPCHPRPVIS